MGFVAIEHFCNGLALVRRERCDINERFNSLLACRSYYGASVSVTG